MKPIRSRIYSAQRTRSLYTTAIANVNPSQPRPVRSHPSLVFPTGQLPHSSQQPTPQSLYYPPFLSPPSPAPAPSTHKSKYELEIGAYGIPKNPRSVTLSPSDAALAVSVGEDAYFIRENALGIADGVGGWSRKAHNELPADSPTASALFARRLMHYCSDEIQHQPPVVASDSEYDLEHWEEELEDHLEDLSDGIDVLQILERAYDRTLAAHVVPEPPETPAEKPPKPLKSGSSTALFAVLESPSPTPSLLSPPASLQILHLGDSSALLVRSDAIAWRSQEMWLDYNTPAQLGPLTSPFTSHHGNLPGSPYTSSGRTITPPTLHNIPAYPDDILILASDGLADNLWDAEILDEVVRVRQSLGLHYPSGTFPSWITDTNQTVEEPSFEMTRKLRASAFPTMLAEALASRAHRRIHSRQRAPCPSETPFTARARLAGKPVPKENAGKNDDITVLVAVVSEQQTP